MPVVAAAVALARPMETGVMASDQLAAAAVAGVVAPPPPAFALFGFEPFDFAFPWLKQVLLVENFGL